MIKLTRLNNHTVAINPDHIGWADAKPDTTLALIGGEKIIVRESLEDLMALVLEFRRAIRAGFAAAEDPGGKTGDPPRVHLPARGQSEPPPRLSLNPSSSRQVR